MLTIFFVCFRNKVTGTFKKIHGQQLNGRRKADFCLTPAFPQYKPVNEDGNIMLTIGKLNS